MRQVFVGVTDYNWYEQLAGQVGIDEVNFWKPGGQGNFRALQPGGLFLFKLHAPHHAIVGGGIFAHFSKLPVSLAWDAFGEKNGAFSLGELRSRVEKYRRSSDLAEDYIIGCILLEEPFFFSRDQWIQAPSDWRPNIVQGRGYDVAEASGRALWQAVQDRLADRTIVGAPRIVEPLHGYGEPVLVRPRLGQGTFRVAVTDAYERRCSVSGERTLPVLQAAHIQPLSTGGPSKVPNGLLLRSDLHTLFDRGYLTVTPDYRIEVSKRIREEYDNGREYYAHHGRELRLPDSLDLRPDRRLLEWHASEVYRG